MSPDRPSPSAGSDEGPDGRPGTASSPDTAPPAVVGGARRRRRSTRFLRPVLTVVLALALGLAAVLARDRIAEWWQTLISVRWQWALVAAVVQLVSVQCVVQVQRVLLRAGGGRAPAGTLTTLTYAGNAISIGVPVAGAAASAAYTYRRLRELGTSTALVGWVLAVSGIASTVTLAAVLAVGSAVTGSAVGAVGAFVATAVAVLPVVGAVLAIRHAATRAVLVRVLQRGAGLLGRWVSALRGAEVERRVEDLLTSLGSFRLGARGVAATGALSLANWVLDAGCLALAVVAVGAPVPWQGLLLVWAAGAVVSSTRLTPGGIGVVETALASALVAAGLPASSAVPAVVVYRLVSLWLLAGIGALCLVAGPRSVPSR